MVHLLAEKYKWTIEYIMNLSMRQIKSLIEGERLILEIRDRNKDGKQPYTFQNNQPANFADKKNNVYDILSIPGVKMSDKAKKILNKIQQKKNKEKT